MAHHLAAASTLSISPRADTEKKPVLPIPSSDARTLGRATHPLQHRRAFAYGLVGTALTLSIVLESRAAARRPPPPPPEEKRDPNVSGLQAKVLASKKRKEAMKAEIAKLREQGKPVN